MHGVGIAKGSFYTFYESKEALFIETLLVVEHELAEGLNKVIQMPGRSDVERFKDFLMFQFQQLETNAFIKILLDPDEMASITRKIPVEQILATRTFQHDYFKQFVEDWQARGLLVKADVGGLVTLLTILPMLGFHKILAGPAFPAAIDVLVNALAAGLMKEGTRSR